MKSDESQLTSLSDYEPRTLLYAMPKGHCIGSFQKDTVMCNVKRTPWCVMSKGQCGV